MIKIAPSLLAADFTNLKNEVSKLNNSGCDYIHLDIMDGVFVNNISFGFSIIKQIRPLSNLYFDVHLMIEKPHLYINELVDCGADLITFHVECYNNIDEINNLINNIKSKNVDVGITLKPDTPIESIVPFLKDVDVVLIMSVNPGFGGQKFIDNQLNKVKYLVQYRNENNLKYLIEIDGGINKESYPKAIESKCDILVAGSYLFDKDMNEKITEMKNYENK